MPALPARTHGTDHLTGWVSSVCASGALVAPDRGGPPPLSRSTTAVARCPAGPRPGCGILAVVEPTGRRPLRLAAWTVLGVWSATGWWAPALPLHPALVVALVALGLPLYTAVLVCPALGHRRAPSPRVAALADAGELLVGAIGCLVAGTLLALARVGPHGWPAALLGLAPALLIAGGLAVAGFARAAALSTGVRLRAKVAVLITWWFPPASVLLLGWTAHRLHDEYRTAIHREERDLARAGDRVCATRYPLVLVHGIFFRDWARFGYWGRIPAALERNGARLFYAGQQSSGTVEAAAAEIATAVRQVCRATGAEKVNVLAHSKGGLDVRWAVSRLGLADAVASVTTIGTPHRGTPLAGRTLDRIPSSTVAAIGQRYEATFTRLGDDSPDFLGGLSDLSPARCALLNAAAPDAPGVVYLSVGSSLTSAVTAPFPLDVGHAVLLAEGAGPNDGLVPMTSMAWGEDFQVPAPTAEGISHGDMIDLRRRDIGGFDVCEHYVRLVAGLRARGL